MKITEEFSISVKRFYLPITLIRKCPNCGYSCKKDLRIDYLSYPTINKKEHIYFYCNDCGHEFNINATLKISLEIE